MPCMSLEYFGYQLAFGFILSVSLRRTYSRRKGAVSGIRRPSGCYDSIFDADKLLRMRDFQSKLAFYENEFTWRFLVSRNLRSLELLGIDRESYSSNADDIPEVLLGSLGLTSLGLSLKPEEGIGNDILKTMINHYQARRKQLGTPLLRLSRLHLGLGFSPVKRYWPLTDPDYKKDLTDLTALADLCIDNWHITDSGRTIPCYDIHPWLFSRATCLEKILVERLSPDITELIEIVKKSSSYTANLKKIEVSRYSETIEREIEETWDVIYHGKPLYSLPHKKLDFIGVR
jgi:hypothetical protein